MSYAYVTAVDQIHRSIALAIAGAYLITLLALRRLPAGHVIQAAGILFFISSAAISLTLAFDLRPLFGWYDLVQLASIIVVAIGLHRLLTAGFARREQRRRRRGSTAPPPGTFAPPPGNAAGRPAARWRTRRRAGGHRR